MTEIELKKRIEYWQKKYFECTSRDERELYLKVYKYLDEIHRIWAKEHRFDKE